MDTAEKFPREQFSFEVGEQTAPLDVEEIHDEVGATKVSEFIETQLPPLGATGEVA